MMSAEGTEMRQAEFRFAAGVSSDIGGFVVTTKTGVAPLGVRGHVVWQQVHDDLTVRPVCCRRVARVVSLIAYGDPAGVRPVIATMPDVEPCLVHGLERAADDGDWLAFGKYVVAATIRPHVAMVDVLCRVLLRRVAEVNNDDIVDLLGTIGDPAAVPALADALMWEPEWDEFRHLASKATWALGQVGTEEARLLVQGAAETGDEWVRPWAAYELRHWQPGGR